MRDKILESYLKDFQAEHSLSVVGENVAFENFVNFCIVSREHPWEFDYEDVHVGGTDDCGIDGIAILVNDHLVTSIEEIEFFRVSLRRFDIQFIFIQAKTSASFDGGDLGNFLFGVTCFFKESPATKENSDIQRFRSLKKSIYDHSIDMDTPPTCRMYYVATGKWVNDVNLVGKINHTVQDLKGTHLFSDVKFLPIDAERISSIYRELKRKVARQVVFDKHTILPTMNKVEEAYIGILPAKEYVKLICDEEGNLLRSLFYDNVRDFQGNNPVNTEIQETLIDSGSNDKFGLFNNGITIVAKSVNKIGATFTIKDFQIVNGCQTSHILYRNNHALNSKIFIPVKLIVTEDPEVTNLIIKGTNRQTEVKLEAFESLSPFQKKLEEFYGGFGKDKTPRLYYERRSKQYYNMPIFQNQIVTLAAQVKCFIAMFLNEPHSTHRYYGELLDANRSRMFLESHSPFPYYVSGFALSVLEDLFSRNELDRDFRKFKYQMLMLFRLKAEKPKMPYINSKEIDEYCAGLLSVLCDKRAVAKEFNAEIALIKQTMSAMQIDSRDAVRVRTFTTALITGSVPSPEESAPATVLRQKGQVISFSEIRGFGFIRPKTGKDLFVHYSDIRGTGYRSLQCGQDVEFTVSKSNKGLLAKDVQVVEKS